jgi:AcrR family transcriptional regulator
MTAPSDETSRPHGLRRDAEENRRRIIWAARQLFAEQGVDVPFDDIARRAGVGVATLYRRFPTRAALIEEIFAAKAQQYIEAAQDALGAEDPWGGFYAYVERICGMQAEDRGFNDVLTMSFPMAPGLEAARGKAVVIQKHVIERAKAQGTLRADFAPEDMIFLLLANGIFVTATSGVNEHAWTRYVALFLDACRADRAHPLPELPLTEEEALRAMFNLGLTACQER